MGRASDGEQALVARIGGLSADPLIRATIDLENGAVVRKASGFSDMLVFWGDEDRVELNAEAEAKRLRAIEVATGEGAEVTIKRRRGFKLPGL